MTPARTRKVARVAAEVSRRPNGWAQHAPIDVGGYALWVNRAECGIPEPDLITDHGAELRIVARRADSSGD